MCGIIGIAGLIDIKNDLLVALENLEYRGYDSAGFSIINKYTKQIQTYKAVGKLAALKDLLGDAEIQGELGIGHTRWATHGEPSLHNTHPITSADVAVVHNGIIENYQELKVELLELGFKFSSETDSEVISHLIVHYLYQGSDFITAARLSALRLKGSFAAAAICARHPALLIGFKRQSPLAVGIGENNNFLLASDVIALSNFTQEIIHLQDDQIVALKLGEGYQITDLEGAFAHSTVQRISRSAAISKGNFETFMLKEIYEQPYILRSILAEHLDSQEWVVNISNIPWQEFHMVHIVACGSSFYAAYIAKYWIERVARIRVEVEIASEFSTRSVIFSQKTLYLFISQSGETADTLAALTHIKSYSARTAAIVNYNGSSIARQVDYLIEMNAGREVAVAATKTFVSQLIILALICFEIAITNATEEHKMQLMESLQKFFSDIQEVYDIEEISQKLLQIIPAIKHCDKFLYIGRDTAYPLSLEGALKLKELSYIAATGIAAGELKHGSIALVDSSTLIVVIAPHTKLFHKIVSSIQEVRARGGQVLLLSTAEGVNQLKDLCQYALALPEVGEFASPILYSLPLQLIAYHMALVSGYDVDKPRNLAKSVTVE